MHCFSDERKLADDEGIADVYDIPYALHGGG